MADETKKDETTKAPAPVASKGTRMPKVGETVHLVHHTHEPGANFAIAHAEAEVEKVHAKGHSVDLVVHADDPAKSLRITSSPRDDEGKKPDSWHFPE